VSRYDPLPRVREILGSDPLWCAYALADTYPPYERDAQWIFEADSLILRYAGLQPPILFAHGDPALVQRLFRDIPPGEYQYGMMAIHFDRLKARLRPHSRQRMWRMALHAHAFPGSEPVDKIVPLGIDDAGAVAQLFDGHTDRPDAFQRGQLSHGITYGYRDGRDLRCVAGTHVVSLEASVAAIGNVFTHPECRDQGLARKTTAAVVQALLERGLRTIVLNVAMDNAPALRCYERLGFRPYCGYYEGVAEVTPNQV
jgi:ribosomal protein S18 acetylase RimI-like enzyme